MQDGDVSLFPRIFSGEECGRLQDRLAETIDWKSEAIRMFGKEIVVPRLTAWHGDEGTAYVYSNIRHEPTPWTPELLEIKSRIEPCCGVSFNSVLLNLYREGQDSMSWHSDDEPELGENPVIGSVSFGASRKFQFRHRRQPELRETVALASGSLLLMAGSTQHFWQHQLPKTKLTHEPRINLTFRTIKLAGKI